MPNGFGPLWLGNLVTILGEDWEKVNCRGKINEMELRPDFILCFSIESAWGEPDEVRTTLENNFPGIKILYYSEEPAMGYFRTNDSAWLEQNRRYVDASIVNKDKPRGNYPTLEAVVEDIKLAFHPSTPPEPTVHSIRNFFDEWMKQNDNDLIELYK